MKRIFQEKLKIPSQKSKINNKNYKIDHMFKFAYTYFILFCYDLENFRRTIIHDRFLCEICVIFYCSKILILLKKNEKSQEPLIFWVLALALAFYLFLYNCFELVAMHLIKHFSFYLILRRFKSSNLWSASSL